MTEDQHKQKRVIRQPNSEVRSRGVGTSVNENVKFTGQMHRVLTVTGMYSISTSLWGKL